MATFKRKKTFKKGWETLHKTVLQFAFRCDQKCIPTQTFVLLALCIELNNSLSQKVFLKLFSEVSVLYALAFRVAKQRKIIQESKKLICRGIVDVDTG